jgi:hypothetical protein
MGKPFKIVDTPPSIYTSDVRTPDHPVDDSTTREDGIMEEKPWKPSGPVNDANKPPMRFD